MKVLLHYILLLLIPVTILITSCTSDGFIMGNKYLDSNIRTVIIDTCTVRMSTVPIERMVTSGNNLLLFGKYEDNNLGETKCSGYFTFSVPSSQTFPENVTLRFDSLELRFALNGTSMGDSTKYHSFNVYNLPEAIEVPEDNDFYNDWDRTNSVTANLVTSFRIKPVPHGNKSISVRMPDAMGEELFQTFIDDNQAVIGSLDKWLAHYGSFAISPADDNNIILGAHLNDTSFVLRLHYHYSTYKKITGTIDVKNLTARSFYTSSADRKEGTIFENLSDGETSSSQTQNKVLVQALTGSYVKIELPYINNLLELGDYGAVLDASLLISPAKGTYSESVPLPKDLSIYISDENDVSVSAITTYSGDQLQTGDLVVDDLFDVNTHYSYDITKFLKDQLGAFGVNRRNLQLIVPSDKIETTLTTLVADDQSSTNGTKLRITYLIYDGK